MNRRAQARTGVAILTPSLAPRGGSELYVQDAVRALLDAGSTVRVCLAEQDGELPVDLAAARDSGHLEIRHHPEIGDTHDPRRMLRRGQRLRRLASELARECDAAVIHLLRSPDLVVRVGRAMPLAFAYHTAFATCPAGNRYIPRGGEGCRRRPGPACLWVDRRRGCIAQAFGGRTSLALLPAVAGHGALQRLYARHATILLFNSEAMRMDYERWVRTPDHAFVIHPPLRTVDRDMGPVFRSANTLACVGRLVASKTMEDALAVVARLPDTRLIVYGDGPEMGRLQKLANDLGVADRIRWAGWVDRNRLHAGLRQAGVLLVTARGYEAFGQIGPQAIAAGCPAVAYDVGGIREWCLPRYGTLVPPGQVGGLVAGVADWLERWRRGLDSSGWPSEARERWGYDRFAREYLDMVEHLLAAD